MQTTYQTQSGIWGLHKKQHTAVLQVQGIGGDSNWRECDVLSVNNIYLMRERDGVTQVAIANIEGMPHIVDKWVDERSLRWYDKERFIVAWHGFLVHEAQS